jgi:hypothetical protein
MISSSLYKRVEFTFPAPAPGGLTGLNPTGLNPFDTRDICLRGVMTDPHGTCTGSPTATIGWIP